MPTTVIIDFIPQDRRFFLLFTDKEFKRVDERWQHEEPLLRELSGNKLFEGKTRWSELRPTQFNFLLMKALHKVSALEVTEQQNEEHPVVHSLHFLIMALIRCIENSSETNVEVLRLKQYDVYTVSFEFNGAVTINLNQNENEDPAKCVKPKLVVDNTGLV